ncbi:hypothetical protein HK105_201197 [Polyrhizophydium stewartii]|uniref:Autophagy-related protein 17 n=1 Tax=Polyrhizophydium stewartii TaxID=2732419 RepID=A0ABR4NJ29_9FUNG
MLSWVVHEDPHVGFEGDSTIGGLVGMKDDGDDNDDDDLVLLGGDGDSPLLALLDGPQTARARGVRGSSAASADIEAVKAAMLEAITDDILIEAADTGNALIPVWRLRASDAVLRDLASAPAASLAHLGLTGDDWTQLVHKDLAQKVSPAVEAMYSRRVDAAIIEHATTLAALVHGIPESHVTAAHIAALPQQVDASLDDLDAAEAQLADAMLRAIDSIETAVAALERTTHSLASWVVAFCGETETERHDAFATYFEAIHTNLRLKLEWLRIELVDAIESGPHGPAIRRASEQMDAASAKIEAAIRAVAADVQQYDQLGDEFKDIIDEWTRVNAQIDTLNRDIARFEVDLGEPAEPDSRRTSVAGARPDASARSGRLEGRTRQHR